MSEEDYYYLDVELKLRENQNVVLTAAYFQGSIENSLDELFGEIGGHFDLQLLKFDLNQKRGIIRVPTEYFTRTRTAITLIGHFQDIPCHFQVNKTSKDPIDF